MKYIFSCIMFLFLISCSAARQQFDQQGLYRLKGKPVEEVFSLLGKPNITVVENQVTKLIYQTNYKTYTPPKSEVYLSGNTYQQGQYLKSSCITTFIVEEKMVRDVFFVGNCL